jgi:2-dehydro-3-deoxygluconokinase
VSRVVTLGKALLLLRVTESGPLAISSEIRTSVAGAELNVAIGLARLGHEVTWVGRVGQDPAGVS